MWHPVLTRDSSAVPVLKWGRGDALGGPRGTLFAHCCVFSSPSSSSEVLLGWNSPSKALGPEGPWPRWVAVSFLSPGKGTWEFVFIEIHILRNGAHLSFWMKLGS